MPVSVDTLLDCLALSIEKGTAIGLRLRGRSSMLITIVRDFYESANEMIVVINDVSIYGEPAGETHIALGEIDSVLNLRICFDDPFYVNLRQLRENIREMRERQIPSEIIESPMLA